MKREERRGEGERKGGREGERESEVCTCLYNGCQSRR